MRKSRLSVALSVAMATAALAPTVGHAVSADIYDKELVTDQSGDAVLFPIYTTVDGTTTSFSLTNTSPMQTVAAKVRIREQELSDEVLDFIVVLSPNDKFDFWVEQPNGAALPQAHWQDNSCVVGYPNVTDKDKILPFHASARSPGTESVGHVEVIGMINLNNIEDRAGNDLNSAAVHGEDGFPVNCQVIREAFKSRANVNGLTYEGLPINPHLPRADVGNVLIGGFAVTAGPEGVEAGGTPIQVRNTFNRGFLAAQSAENCAGPPPVIGVPGDPSTITQGTDYCFQLYSWDGTEDSHPHIGDINWVGVSGFPNLSTVARLDDLLTAAISLRGDWSNNPANFVGVDWITTYPTKYVYVDAGFGCPAVEDYVNVGDKAVGYFGPAARCTTPTPFGLRGAVPPHCIINGGFVFGSVFNTEEGSITTESPGNKNPLEFCPETQLFTIAALGETPEPSLLQTDARRLVLEYDPSLTGVRGWADLPINWYPSALVPTHASNIRDGAVTSGLLFVVRATTDPTVNNGSLRELESNSGRQE